MRVKGTTHKDCKLIIFGDKDVNGQCNTYNGTEYKMIDFSLVQTIRKNPFDYDVIYVPFKKAKFIKTMEQQYKQLIQHADELKEVTDGKVNLYRTGSYKRSSLQLFHDLCEPDEHDPIPQWEANIINMATVGALMHSKQYEGVAYSYDKTSHYPSIMRSSHCHFPCKEGILSTLTITEFKEMKYYRYGFYHVIVSGNIDSRLFRKNPNDWYTHIDLNLALKHGYVITLIENIPNCLSYDGKIINASKLFAPFVDYLFSLKQKGYQSIKHILTPLWGALIESNKFDIRICEKGNDTIGHDKHLEMFAWIGDDLDSDKLKVSVVRKSNQFVTNFARLKPFMLAYGRVYITSCIVENLDNLVQLHTDGFILSKPIKAFKSTDKVVIGSDIGQLKYKGKCDKCVISNCNSVIGTFKL